MFHKILIYSFSINIPFIGKIEEIIGEDIINLFVPTTPNPTSGFFVIIPKKDAIELKMSVEEAFKLVISAGVVTPETLKIKENK